MLRKVKYAEEVFPPPLFQVKLQLWTSLLSDMPREYTSEKVWCEFESTVQSAVWGFF